MSLPCDLSKSLFYYQKTFTFVSNDAAILSELYKVMLSYGSAENVRFKLLKDNISLVKQRDDLLSAYLDLLISNKYYDMVLLYPKNLRVAKFEPDWTGYINYYKAENYQKLGQIKKAKKLWAQVANYNTYIPTLVTYYKALFTY